MDPASIAASLVMSQAASQADLIAIKLLKRNAEASQNVISLLDDANQNMNRIQASLGSGMGGALDITV